MLLACIPFTASAAETTWENRQITAATVIGSGETVRVKGVVTSTAQITVNEGAALIIDNAAALVITGDAARLENNGTVTVSNGATLTLTGEGEGELYSTLYNGANGIINIAANGSCTLGKGCYAYNYGLISSVDRMTLNGILYNMVTIPEDFPVEYRYTETWNRTNMTVDFKVEYYMYSENSGDLDYLNDTLYKSDRRDVPVENGNKIFILITPEEGDGDWVDTGRMKLTVNGQLTSATDRIDNDRGVFCITPTSAVTATIYSTAYKDIEKIFEIELPRTEGYYTITKDGDVDVATVEYGKTLSFRLVLSEDYDKSDYDVYVNTIYMEPDEYGYYDVTGPIDAYDGLNGTMASEGGVQQDLKITVFGIAPNDRVDMMTSIVSFVKEIFDVIREIFSYFLDLFNFGS